MTQSEALHVLILLIQDVQVILDKYESHEGTIEEAVVALQEQFDSHDRRVFILSAIDAILPSQKGTP